MSNYYADKREAVHHIGEIIRTNKGKKIPMSALRLKFLSAWGFGNAMLQNLLDPFIEIGELVYLEEEDKLEVKK